MTPSQSKEGDSGGGGGDGGSSDQLIQAIIQKLPDKGPWPTNERVIRMKLPMAFDLAYGVDGKIEIKDEAAN